MVTQHTFKKRVRARMAKTGESYTAARRMLIAAGDAPEETGATFEPPVADEAVAAATGQRWESWFGALDAAGAVSKTHTQIAALLVDDHGVSGWWAQSITVAYERARGLRAVGQHADGWAITATKTIGVPVEGLYAAVTDDETRARWLPGAELRLRTKTASKVARYDWEDGSTRVAVFFSAKTEASSTLSVEHARLPDADTADEMKTYWRGRVTALKALLEA
jgi:uncharacterized protein YndB with AHSA1/START domain